MGGYYNAGGVQDGTKAMGSTGTILVTLGGSQSPEEISWAKIMSNLRDHSGGTSLSNTLQYVSVQNGSTRALTNSRGKIGH